MLSFIDKPNPAAAEGSAASLTPDVAPQEADLLPAPRLAVQVVPDSARSKLLESGTFINNVLPCNSSISTALTVVASQWCMNFP